ncbi:MAG: radical SAM protein [Sedimentisphaerales bacterium]|nr:radical SAM protein [Sedimentisphaerales bacterium]
MVTQYVFGPVPSRRLGRSLGVDLVPFKTCSYDCIYCQLARTTCKTIERKEWVPLKDVVEQLKAKLPTNPDYITLSGSGEPTLYSRTGELIEQIKQISSIPIAVLTNGSLLWQPEVRQSIMKADLIVPSLDAGCEEIFQKINRPHPEITFDVMLEGLVQLRREYKGQYWLEVFLSAGINTMEDEINRLADCVRRIGPDKVQLNTVTRPPTEDFARTVSLEKMEEYATIISDHAEVIADYQEVHARQMFAAKREDIMNLLSRRPCSLEEIADVFGLHRNEVIKFLEDLSTAGKITKETQGKKLYYKAN